MVLSIENIVVHSLNIGGHKRHDYYPIQAGDIPEVFSDDGHIQTFVYIQAIDPEIEQVWNEFLKHLGGQTHV